MIARRTLLGMLAFLPFIGPKLAGLGKPVPVFDPSQVQIRIGGVLVEGYASSELVTIKKDLGK